MRYATISGTGMYVPGQPIENKVFNARYQKDIDAFLREKRNIYQRYFMKSEEATSDLILPAANQALQRAKKSAEQIDLIIVATDTPDYVSPSTASVVQHMLGAKNAGFFDLNTACAGFVTALDMAAKYIASDKSYRNILVVGAYAMSKYLDWDDHKTATVFADGAAAVVVSEGDEPGVLAARLFGDGVYHDYMGIYGGGTRTPITPQVIEEKKHLLKFEKRIPPEFNAEHWPRIIFEIADRAQVRVQDIKHFFMTQINIDAIRQTMEKLELPFERAFNVMDRYGYTGSACIPMAIDTSASQHVLKKGDLVCLMGSGGGVSMAGVLLRWSYDT